MDKTEKLKHIILSRYNSIREFSKMVDIPSTTLTSALDKGIGGMAVDRIIRICEVLKIDIKTFEPINNENEFMISKEEENHIEDLRKLNDLGKRKVLTYTKDLTEMPKYQNNAVDTIAAHNDYIDNNDELSKINEDIDDMKNW